MEKCMHILPMNKLSGAEKMALLICANLKHYEPVVVCGGDELAELFRKRNIKCYTVNFHSKHFFRIISELKKIIKENEIRLLHCHDNTASFYGYMVKRIYKLDVKIISHVHSCYPFLKNGGINKALDNRVRNKYDYNIMCGTKVFDFYKENTDYIDEKKVIILSNAVDVNGINYNLKQCEDIRGKYKISKDKTVIGYVGRFEEMKGLIPFIKALRKQIDKFADSVFLLVGNGSQEKEIKDLIKKLELDDYFILTGFDSDIFKYYKAMNIFFLPSEYEGLPMVLLESMAAKVAIISMNVGGIGELLSDGRGILIETGQYDDFIDKLIKFEKNDTLRLGMARKAYSFIEENYDIQQYVYILQNIYSNLLKEDK